MRVMSHNARQDKEAQYAAERERIIVDWDADRRPVHCANCRWCVVGGRPDEPLARCAQGHGTVVAIPLARLLRPSLPRQFIPAADCPDFDSMAEGEPWR